MKNNKYIYTKITFLIVATFLVITSCERKLSDEVEFATYPTTPGVFIDGFVGGLDYFPFGGSFAEAFSVETDETYLGSASMRFDIPVFGVGYGGATFPSTGSRDLSGYDALTFWAKASQGSDINEIGFGINEETNNKYQVTMRNLPLTTVWTKYTIPIPDPSKLIQEKGMFWYAEGAENAADEGGYTFWIDELKFEKLGTIAQPKPAILNGIDEVQQSFVGSKINLQELGLTQTFNLGSGENQTILVAPSYFTFTSTNVDVARVSELGVISVVGMGNATITASLGGVLAKGSLVLEVGQDFVNADTPPVRDSNDVISIFSDAYTNVEALNFAEFNGPKVQIEVTDFSGDQVIEYSNLDFVGLGWDGTVDVSSMTHMHVDIQVNGSTNPSLIVELIDFGANNSDGGGDDTGGGSTVASSDLIDGTWVGLDIPINEFTQATGGGFLGSPNLNNIARVVFVSTNGSSILVDNIYFYR